MPREPPTRPMTIHGRRMPSRDVVRSLILPKNGLPTIASKAPTPATRARLFGACLIPTSEFTFNGKVTSKGAMNSRLVLMYASAYRAMKPGPTRCAAGGPGPAAALLAVRYFDPRRTEPSRAAGPANRTTRADMIRKAMVTPLGAATRTIPAAPPAPPTLAPPPTAVNNGPAGGGHSSARCGEQPADRAVARMAMTASSLTRTGVAGWSKTGFFG